MTATATRLVDTHCHLTSERFASDRHELIRALPAHGVVRAILIATGLADAAAAATLRREHPTTLRLAVGLDPFTCHHRDAHFADDLAGLGEFLATEDCCALGEIGLEYHHQVNSRERQIEQLHAQLELAANHDLPVVIHVREAHADMRAVLAEHPRNRGVVHSFTAGPSEAEAYLALGWHLAFNGVATFRNAPEVRDAARLVPDDRLLVETDSPYLAPMPHRGKRNEPAHVAHVVERLAEERAQSPDQVAAWTTRNADRLFGLGLAEER